MREKYPRDEQGRAPWEVEGIPKMTWVNRHKFGRRPRAEYLEAVREYRLGTSGVVQQTTEERRSGFEAYDRLRALGREVNLAAFMAESGLSRIVYEHVKAAREAEERVVERDLSETMQARFDRRVQKLTEVLRAQCREEARVEYVKWYHEHVRPQFQEELDRARRIADAAKGVFNQAELRLITACLHPDNSASEGRRAEAFRLIREKADLLCPPPLSTAEERARRPQAPMPQSFEEMVARRRRK